MASFRGAGKYNKKTKIFKNYVKGGDIINSVLTDIYNNEIIYLENYLSITTKIDNMIYIYHSYNNENHSGRWYNTINKNILNNLPNNKLTIILDDYKFDDDTIGNYVMTIEFTNKGIIELKKL